MLGNAALSEHCDHPSVETVATVVNVCRTNGPGSKRVGVQTAEMNKDWVACLIRIRDDRDETAFVEVFRHFAPRVKSFLMRGGADAALAEECVQEVMATVWHKAALFDPQRASVSTWIFTIARNKKIDVLRRVKRPEPEDLPWGPEAAPDQAEVIGLQQESEQLGEAMASLPEKQRDLIEKAYFGDLTHSEIADLTGLPLGTIKSRIRLALDRLRHAMDTK
jgi:RNA polymerase sigma-70 factor (ECF subfamily)